MSAAVLIPIKSFDLAKGRLAGALDEPTRAAIARRMATTVIAAARGLPTWVICDDADVAGLSIAQGANVLWRPARGLNAAVTEGVDFLAAEGFSRAVIAHADLPLARELTWLGAVDGVTVVTDRRADGTNVLSIPTGTGFVFHYGVGSAAAHRAEADRLGLVSRVIDDPELGWDVDVPEDLVALTEPAAVLATGDTPAARSDITDLGAAHADRSDREAP